MKACCPLIRQLGPPEFDAIFPLLREWFESSKILRHMIFPSPWQEGWKVDMARGDAVILGLFEDQRLYGVLGGLRFSPDHITWVAIEMFWYVAKEKRGRGLYLLGAFERWAREKGCKVVGMVHLLGEEEMGLSKIYGRRGYKLTKYQDSPDQILVYAKRLPDGQGED